MGSLSQSQSAPVSTTSKSIDTEIREGDWDAYQLYSARCSNKDGVADMESLLTYRQQCALAYLGKRAQFHGGVCSKIQPRIFTAHFINELGVSNKVKRFKRYPWLEKFVDLIAEIEREQENTSGSGNVISLIVASK
jgi:hypothetical protein